MKINDAPLIQPILLQRFWVTWKLHGTHCYPNAPDEVAYLKVEHRHLFGFKVTLDVTHQDREIEFHMLQNRCIEFCKDKMGLDHMSCEMMATKVLTFVEGLHGTNRNTEVQVDEDGECGAVVRFCHGT